MYSIIISATIALIYIFGTWFMWKQDRLLHKIRMRNERAEQVIYFKIYVLNTFGVQACQSLPDYDTMLNSDKPLVVKEWVEVDKIINLN